ncbi:hypothetical protein [Streptomyces sp. NPDC056192]|uniref:hypothetical protein n=1 Tax=unclassified Streptomyces TaxID=2593676 RepID=UPI0035E1E64F
MARLKSCPASRTYYERKRGEGKGRRKQALIALARRRVNVLRAMIRERATNPHRVLFLWFDNGIGMFSTLHPLHMPCPMRRPRFCPEPALTIHGIP